MVGEYYFRISRGIDERPVNPARERKSVGAEQTFETDIQGVDAVRASLTGLSETLLGRLSGADHLGRTVMLKLKFADHRVVTRRASFGRPLQDARSIRALGAELVTPELLLGQKVRLVGLSITGARPEADQRQPPLLSE